MKQIIGGRGTGKTIRLIYQSAWSGATIVTATNQAAVYIEHMAEQLHLEIPKPMSIVELRAKREMPPKATLIDELDAVVAQLLAPCYTIEGYSLTQEGENDRHNKRCNE